MSDKVTGEERSASVPEWLRHLNAEADRRYNAVDWQQGKWYAIYDERDKDSVASASLFKCEIDPEGTVYLVGDQCDYDRQSGHEPDVHEARGYITSGSVVVPQS